METKVNSEAQNLWSKILALLVTISESFLHEFRSFLHGSDLAQES